MPMNFIDSVMANGALCTLTEKDIGKKKAFLI